MIEIDAGLSCLVSLMELYCGGNNVEGVREVGHLRGLLKLIILDLTGNPVAAHDDYRLYTIYHLRKLKVTMHGMRCAFYYVFLFLFHIYILQSAMQALEGSDLSWTYLAHHGLKSVVNIMSWSWNWS